MPKDKGPKLPWLTIVGSAAFLACSWTWCIGMFLPILLARDFGPWSMLAFAAPNITGAILMGWVLRQPGRAAAYLETHGPLIRAFSGVTIAFQWFFLVWLVATVGFLWSGAVLLVGAILVQAIVDRPRADGKTHWRVALLLIAVSSAMLLATIPNLQFTAPPPESSPLFMGTSALAMLAPALVLGFALCPYLDGTFLRVRATLPEPAGTVVFVIGFGGFFALMLLFTQMYTGAILGESAANGASPGPQWSPWPVWTHIALQAAFTIAVHGRALAWASRRRVAKVEGGANKILAWCGRNVAVLAGVAGTAAAIVALQRPGYAGITATELVYRVFLGFYAVAFPAAVLILAWPGGRLRRAGTIEWGLWTFVAAVAGAGFWIAAIERQSVWYLPATGLLLAGGAAAWWLRRTADRAKA